MRDGSTDTVTPGGPHAPLGARTPPSGGEPLTRRARPTALLVVLSVTLAGYAALAADVVHGGVVSELDTDVAAWVAGSMPGWAEWLVRPFTWLGGVVGATVVVAPRLRRVLLPTPPPQSSVTGVRRAHRSRPIA